MDTMTCHFQDLWMPPAEREPAVWCKPSRQVPTSPSYVPAEQAKNEIDVPGLLGSVARAAVEALTGYRPVQQLGRWLDQPALDGLSLAMRHGTWRGATVVKTSGSIIRENVIEGVAQVATKGRRVAIAMRLERRRETWACTELSVLLPGSHMVSRR
ncbi:MAG: Rv3235 family protein [Propionibacteriaceae bacterium]|nr:Rv3235 family protein [Propionibacteriaceae bacterium]